MKKLLFGIFAHPDDEAFGPSAFLYAQAQAGTDVHLILVTDGESGTNEGYEDLAKVRLEEWHESGKRIGASSNKALHYPDGGLCNNLYLEISDKIIAQIKSLIGTYTEDVELDFITFEAKGLTGHIDHIAVSFITTFVYEKIKGMQLSGTTMGILRYYCLPETMVKTCNCDWIYMPAGHKLSEIDEIVDFSAISDKKIHIMEAHVSQKNDMNYILSHDADTACSEDHFIHYKG